MFNLSPIILGLLYIPANFLLANWLFKECGVKITLALGAILNCLCLWCRTLINYNFVIAMASGIFSGIAQPLLLNADTEVASRWFDTNEVLLIVLN